MKGKTPLSHCEFYRAICMAKIDPLGHGSCKQRGSIAFQRGDHRGKPRKYSSKRSAPSVASTASVSYKRQKAASVTCKRLEDLSHGFQATRLDRGLCHLSVPACVPACKKEQTTIHRRYSAYNDICISMLHNCLFEWHVESHKKCRSSVTYSIAFGRNSTENGPCGWYTTPSILFDGTYVPDRRHE